MLLLPAVQAGSGPLPALDDRRAGRTPRAPGGISYSTGRGKFLVNLRLGLCDDGLERDLAAGDVEGLTCYFIR